MLTAEQADVCRNLVDSAGKAMKSKRILHILTHLQDGKMIDWDPFSGSISLTEDGRTALANWTFQSKSEAS